MKIIYWLLTLFSLGDLSSWLTQSGMPDWLMFALTALIVPNLGLLVLFTFLFSLSSSPFHVPEQLLLSLLFATLGLFLVQGAYWLVGKVTKLTTQGQSLPPVKARWWWLLWLLAVVLITSSAIDNARLWNGYGINVWFFMAYLSSTIAVLFYLLLGSKKLLQWLLRKKWSKFTPATKHKYSLAWRVALGIFWLWASIACLFNLNWLLIPDHPMMSTYAVLNAALKNTCFIDPSQENCPHQLIELSYIEPKEYQTEITDSRAQAHYHYDQASGFYTFIIRYRPERALIFDWRLVDELGVDFLEVEVDLWSNQVKQQDATFDWIPDEILTFPEWSGPYWRLPT